MKKMHSLCQKIIYNLYSEDMYSFGSIGCRSILVPRCDMVVEQFNLKQKCGYELFQLILYTYHVYDQVFV